MAAMLLRCGYLVSSRCLVHGTTTAFSDRMPRSPSTIFCSRVFRTQPTVSACTSVHWRSVRPSWMMVSATRRWMPWWSRNVPQHGRSFDCDTLVDTYLILNTATSLSEAALSTCWHNNKAAAFQAVSVLRSVTINVWQREWKHPSRQPHHTYNISTMWITLNSHNMAPVTGQLPFLMLKKQCQPNANNETIDKSNGQTWT